MGDFFSSTWCMFNLPYEVIWESQCYAYFQQMRTQAIFLNRPQSIMFVLDMFIECMYYEELDAATAARLGLGTVPSRNPFLEK